MCQPESVAVFDTPGFAEMIVGNEATTVMGLSKRLYVCISGGLRKSPESARW